MHLARSVQSLQALWEEVLSNPGGFQQSQLPKSAQIPSNEGSSDS